MNRPIPRRPLPRRKGRRLRAAGDAATLGGIVLFILFVVVSALLPLGLMAAGIHYLLTH